MVINVTEGQVWTTGPIPDFVLHADVFIIIIYFVATIVGKSHYSNPIFEFSRKNNTFNQGQSYSYHGFP